MITKTRPVETVEQVVKQERQFDWTRVGQAVLNIAVTISALYLLHVTYIHIWRMLTGH